MENGAERGLAIILRLTEHVGVYPICFETSGPTGINIVVNAAAG